jgi:hypothetical protein
MWIEGRAVVVLFETINHNLQVIIMFIEFVFLSSPHFLRQNDSTPNSGFQIKSIGCKSEEENLFVETKKTFSSPFLWKLSLH